VFKHFTDEVQINLPSGPVTIKKTMLQEKAQAAVKKAGGVAVVVWDIEVEKLERPDAVVTFLVRPNDEREMVRCRMRFLLVREGEWRVKGFELLRPVGDQNQLIPLPF